MEVKAGQWYRHFKGFSIEVLLIALDSETTQKMVIYRHHEQDEVWVRPEKMFFEEVDVTRADNITGQKYRFELINKKEEEIV